MMVQKWFPNFIGAILGILVGIGIGLWFKSPDHTVDSFAFVETAMGIGLTVIALIVTLGVIQQRAAMETMLATKRDEMVVQAKSKLETETFAPFRSQYLQEFQQLKGEVETYKNIFNTNHSTYLGLGEEIKLIKTRLDNLEKTANAVIYGRALGQTTSMAPPVQDEELQP